MKQDYGGYKMNKNIEISEISNGYLIKTYNAGRIHQRVYEDNNDITLAVARKQTMCRLMNDLAEFFNVNDATDILSVVAHLEEKPTKGRTEYVKEKEDLPSL